MGDASDIGAKVSDDARRYRKSLRNLETGMELQSTAGAATLALEPHGFALVEVRTDSKARKPYCRKPAR